MSLIPPVLQVEKFRVFFRSIDIDHGWYGKQSRIRKELAWLQRRRNEQHQLCAVTGGEGVFQTQDPLTGTVTVFCNRRVFSQLLEFPRIGHDFVRCDRRISLA